MIEGELALALFGSVCVLLLFGFPVAFTLAGTALLFAAIGVIAGHFDASFVAALSGRIIDLHLSWVKLSIMRGCRTASL